MARRLVDALTGVSITGLTVSEIVHLKSTDVFSILLDKKATISGAQVSLLGDRRKLEKAINLIETRKNKDGTFRTIEHTGRISSNNTLWTVQMEVGGSLQVFPAMRRLATSLTNAQSRLNDALLSESDL